jgi:hypothetical protein
MKTQIIGKDRLETVNLNRRKAIHERCLNCACWHPKDVTDCDFIECPLYQFRTGGGKQDTKLRTKAIKEYCLWCAKGQVGEITKCPSVNCSLFAYRKGGLERAITSLSFEKIVNIEGLFSIKEDTANKIQRVNPSFRKTMSM